MAGNFCKRCGAWITDPARAYCARCGTSLPMGASISVASAASPWAESPAAVAAHEFRVRAIAIQQLSKRPWWPWALAFAGLLLAAVFGVRSHTAYQAVRLLEASSETTAALGFGVLGRLFSPGGVGVVVDPRYQSLYVQASREMVDGAVMALFGLVVALVGLMIQASWQPQFVSGPAEKRRISFEP